MLHYIKGIQRKFGFSIIGGTRRDDISMQLASRDFSAMLDLYKGGCQAAPGDLSKKISNILAILGYRSLKNTEAEYAYYKIVRGSPRPPPKKKWFRHGHNQ